MKNIGFKILTLVLSILIIVQALPMSTFAQELLDTEPYNDTVTQEATIVAENESLRSENTKHFRMSDGTYTAAIYQEPVHYEKDGEWV